MRNLIHIVESLNEVEIGGAVEDDYLRDLRQNDYDNAQLDLFKEIPSLDPNLPPQMKIIGKLGSYRVIHKKEDRTCDTIILFDRNKPIAFLGLCEVTPAHDISGYIENGEGKQVTSVYLDPEYRGNNLGLQLYHWVLSNICDYLVADQMQTRDGTRLWKKMQNSRKFNVEVFDRRSYSSRKRWVGKDFNQVYKTDGVLIPWVTIPSKMTKLFGD